MNRFTASLLLLLASGTVAAAAAVNYLPWAEKAPNVTPTIAVFSNDHKPIENAQSNPPSPFLPVDDPSIDFYPHMDDPRHPELDGVFRVNPIYLPDNDGQAKIGILLPLHSVATFGSPGPGSSDIAQLVTQGHLARVSHGVTCDTRLESGGVLNAGKLVQAISGDFTWKVECRSYGTVIWLSLPAATPGPRGAIGSGDQRVISNTAAQVHFSIPDFPGLTRKDFESWSLQVNVATGSDLPDEHILPLAPLFGEEAAPVVGLHETDATSITSAFPSNFDIRTVSFLGQVAHLWPVHMDGESNSFSAEIVSNTRQRWSDLFGFTAPFFVGSGLTALVARAYRRSRGAPEG